MRAATIVARENEFARIHSVVDRARTGSGGAVAIVGEAGVGKSALVRNLISDGNDVVLGRATPPPSPPLRALSEIASALVRRGAGLEDPKLRVYRGALRALLPAAATTGSAEAPTPLHLGDALLQLRDTCGPRAPRVLVHEDLHWADPTTLAVVEYLVDNAGAFGVAVVLTLRPEEEALQLVRRLATRHSLDLVELDRLRADEVSQMAVACLGAALPAGLASVIDRAEGIPLLIEELLTSCEQRGELVRGPEGWRYNPSASASLPATVVDSVSSRLATMDGRTRTVIEAAALLGRTFDSGLLPGALEVTDDLVRDSLQQALRLGLLSPEPGAWRLQFSHVLVREAVLEVAAPSARRSTARMLIGALERVLIESNDIELAASLATEAGDLTRAASLAEVAGHDLMTRGLPSAAAASFERSIGLEPTGPDALARRQARLEALALSGDVERAEEEGRQLLRQLTASGADTARHDACRIAIARASANAGRWADAEQTLQCGSLDAGTPSSLAAMVALERGRFEDAEQLARAVVDAGTDTASICESAEVLGRLARRRDLDEARIWFEHAAATAELNGSALWRARALHELATIDQLRSLAVDGLYRAREEAIAAGAPGLLSAVEFHLAALHGVRFEPDEALTSARRCLDTARSLGAVRQQAWAWNLIGQAHAARGDRIRANASADEAIARAEDDAEILGVAIGTARGLASLLAEDRDRAFGQWRTAIEHLRRLPERVPLPPWYLWPLLATVHDLEGDGGLRAREETDIRELRLGPGVDGLWHLATAAAFGRDGDVDAAQREATMARELFARVPDFAGYIHLGTRLVAEAALHDGWGEPALWLPEASSWFASRGLTEPAKACDALGRRAGVRQRRKGRGDSTVSPGLAKLGVTSREVDVLNLLRDGLTNREIAERLYLSPRTVKGHVENLLTKTGLTNRTQLAALTTSDG